MPSPNSSEIRRLKRIRDVLMAQKGGELQRFLTIARLSKFFGVAEPVMLWPA